MQGRRNYLLTMCFGKGVRKDVRQGVRKDVVQVFIYEHLYEHLFQNSLKLFEAMFIRWQKGVKDCARDSRPASGRMAAVTVSVRSSCILTKHGKLVRLCRP